MEDVAPDIKGSRKHKDKVLHYTRSGWDAFCGGSLSSESRLGKGLWERYP